MGSLQIGSGSAAYAVRRIPNTKAEGEKRVLDTALDAARSRGLDLYNLTGLPIKNPEDDLDFTLPTRNGGEHLDLMEAVRDLQAQGGYEGTPTSYNVGEIGREVWKNLLKKSTDHRRRPLRRPAHLLLYSTDWRFLLGTGALDLLAFWAGCREHIFSTIKYVCPDAQSASVLEHIFPRPIGSFAGFDESGVAKLFVVFGDIRKPHVQSNGSVIIPVQIP